MTELMPIPTVELSEPKLPRGNLGKLAWLPVSSLCVDQKYQRAFRSENAKRVREIACAFDWTLFSPIVVASAGAKYAVIDGQHRAAAALAVGAREVPAWVIEADAVAQSKMFIALNATTTKVQSMQLWHARLAARDPDALATFEVCRKAGVEIMRYPLASIQRKPHQTMCPDVINTLRQAHGDKPITDALIILRLVGELQESPMILKRYIRAMLQVCKAPPIRKEQLEPIAAKLAEHNFDDLWEQSRRVAKDRGEHPASVLIVKLAKIIAGLRGGS